MAYADTPRTDAGNATYMSNGQNLENFSVENSFLSPLKRKDDVISAMRSERGISLRTPRARVPFSDRRNLPTAPGRGEFTPLLHSVAKKNLERNAKISGAPETPAFLKAGYQGSASPALPGGEASAIYGSELGSSVVGDSDGAPMPQIASSSAQSTPLATLPKREATGVLNDQGSLMTLREQENIINKIEKENFGLKLKIHFLEDALRKTGPGFNEAALKENTDLKVDRITLQKELTRCKKTLIQAERDVEAYRRHLEEVQEKARHEHADEGIKEELEELRKGLASKETELEGLRQILEASEGKDDGLEKLKGDIEDLQADLREKDRLIDERDDEIDRVKAQASKDSEELDEVYAELEAEKKRAEERQDSTDYESKLNEVQEELQEALEAKQQAEDNLEEIRDEMSNKSITTKGLSRQLEEKANKLQDDLIALRDKYSQLQADCEDKSKHAKKIEEKLLDHEQDADVRDQKLRDQNELLRNDHDSLVKKCESLTGLYQHAIKDVEKRSEEKDLLNSRHDALTSESQALQKDLSKAHSRVQEVEYDLENEKHYAEENERRLRSEAKDEITRLTEEIDSVYREIADKETRSDADHDLWDSQRRGLQSQKERAEEQAAGLQRTIDKLQEIEGTLSSREYKLQEALESEKQRHRSEEAVMERQIKDLNDDVEEKRRMFEDLRSDLSQAKEELRVSQRQHTAAEEKVQALEDEVEVLQSGLDEETEKGKEEMESLEKQAETLRHQLAAAQEDLEEARSASNGESSPNDEIKMKLHGVEEQLRNVKSEKLSLQDRLATKNLEVHQLQASLAEVELGRDEMRNRMEGMQSQEDVAAVLSLIHQDLSAARKKEIEYLQRETAQKEIVKDLKQKVTQIESRAHEAEAARLAAFSPRSSVGDSNRKSELVETQRQLADARQQLKESRAKSKDDLKFLQHKLTDFEKQIQANLDTHEQQRDQLEAELSSLRHEQESLASKNTTATQTITRLRSRISSLEQDLQAHRQTATADNTIAEERKDLHEMLKDAKLQAEDLQVQITSRETSLAAATTRENDLRSQLRRVREERSLEAQKANALSKELDDLQKRYERAIDSHSRHQRKWDEERKAMVSRVRFANTSISTLPADDKEKLEQRHGAELRGLAKQIQWLRAKYQREEGFRMGLVYEKRFLMMQIEMFEACNKIDLSLLQEIGVHPANAKASTRLRLGDALRGGAQQKPDKRPSLRAVGFMVLASCRLQKMAGEWAEQRKIREALGRKMEGMAIGKGRRVSGRG